jgi:hypothetical protein
LSLTTRLLVTAGILIQCILAKDILQISKIALISVFLNTSEMTICYVSNLLHLHTSEM